MHAPNEPASVVSQTLPLAKTDVRETEKQVSIVAAGVEVNDVEVHPSYEYE